MRLVRSVTWSKGEHGDNLETILKICNHLAQDGILKKRNWFSKKCDYRISGDNVIVYSLPTEQLTAKETAEIICKELSEYFVNAENSSNHIFIKFNRELEEDYSIIVKDSLSKILKH